MTWQILMFSFSTLPNYRWDFCQDEQCTGTAGELLRTEHGRQLTGLRECQASSPARAPCYLLQEAQAPCTAQNRGTSGLEQWTHLGIGDPEFDSVVAGVRGR